MILYSLDKSLAINGINLRQEYRREQWRKSSIAGGTQNDVKQMRWCRAEETYTKEPVPTTVDQSVQGLGFYLMLMHDTIG